MKRLRIGTRGSALALWQARHVAGCLGHLLPDVPIALVEMASEGDHATDVPLSHVEGTGFFTAAIEGALARGDIDIAVHSYKDLPVESAPGLVVAAVPIRGPVEDALCARDGWTLDTLPGGARVGTCSARRTAQVRARRPDVEIVPLRGNVPTRLSRVGRDLDAVVLARAGLVRLGLEDAISQVFPVEEVLPAPAQGALAVQCRADDVFARSAASALDDGPTRRAVETERALLHALQGGCSVPVGAAARTVGSTVEVVAGVFGLSGRRAVRAFARGGDPEPTAATAARSLLDGGAADILAEFAVDVTRAAAATSGGHP
jgi:hydroxymethylbilane synthase